MIQKELLKKIVRKTGHKTRILYTYASSDSDLKRLHSAYVNFIRTHSIPSTFAHAYTKNRSIYSNARIHLFNDVFVKIDVKNFFPSLNHNYLIEALDFELNRKEAGTITKLECEEIVKNSTVAKVGLPLGLSPSPDLSNIYMKRFDSIFYGKLRKMGLDNVLFTRYADDIFVSFRSKDTVNSQTIDNIINICSEELAKCHLKINDQKTKVIDLHRSNHVKLAGVNIVTSNQRRKLTVSRSTIKELYFNALSAYSSIQDSSANDIDAEISHIKGMQSFILSIEKKGYSHILSHKMQQSIKDLGYENLESLIGDLKTSSKSTE